MGEGLLWQEEAQEQGNLSRVYSVLQEDKNPMEGVHKVLGVQIGRNHAP
jgi:hypothetical protein